jgi:FO synthase
MARLLLHGAIDNIQCSWVKLGTDGCVQVLRGGVNDVGGTLMEETISRMAGSQHGSARTVAELEALGTAAGRPVRQRTTTYGEVPAERIAAARAARAGALASGGAESGEDESGEAEFGEAEFGEAEPDGAVGALSGADRRMLPIV